MWVVRFALRRPYAFVTVAVLIAIFGIVAILKTPTDILPDIDIPIVSVIWTYSGLDADDMSKRIIGVCERALPTIVNNIQYTESQSYNGIGVIKIHFQPGVQIDLAMGAALLDFLISVKFRASSPVRGQLRLRFFLDEFQRAATTGWG
jgi:multidrug efflux pump subunit AcrB